MQIHPLSTFSGLRSVLSHIFIIIIMTLFCENSTKNGGLCQSLQKHCGVIFHSALTQAFGRYLCPQLHLHKQKDFLTRADLLGPLLHGPIQAPFEYSSVRLPNTVVHGRSSYILHNPKYESYKAVLCTQPAPQAPGTTTHIVLEILLILRVDLDEVGGCRPGHHGEIIIPCFSPCSTYGLRQFLPINNPFNWRESIMLQKLGESVWLLNVRPYVTNTHIDRRTANKGTTAPYSISR